MKKQITRVSVAVALALSGSVANASLILLSPVDFGGTGLGAVNTILTVQATGNGSTETGSVSWNGTADVIPPSDAKTGASQTQTRTLSELGVTSASTLRVVFNANELGNAPSIQLDNMVLSIFSPTGTTLFTSGAFSSILFPDTQTGTGNSGFVFGLDAAQAATAQTQAFGGSFGNNRVGLSASLSLVSDGPETFFVANAPAVPEPGTWALLASGLLAFGGIARRKPINQS